MSNVQPENGRIVRLAAWQGRCVDGDVDANVATARRVIASAAKDKVDFLCFPECFLSGYGDREMVERAALSLDDARLRELAREAGGHNLVVLIGFAERLRGGALGNTVAVLSDGTVSGIYRKTMLIGLDVQTGFCRDYDLPVFREKGVSFGCIICADSSHVEVAMTMAYKGARIIFSPHYNSLKLPTMDSHRLRVRNNHVGLAALLGVYVVRANVIVTERPDELGYGDTAIFAPGGVPLAEAGLFTEKLIVADADLAATSRGTIQRDLLPERVRLQLAEQLQCYQRTDPARAPAGPDHAGVR